MSPDEKKDLYGEIAKINANMSRVLFILESDQKTNAMGLVEKVSQNKMEIDLVKKEIEQIKTDKKIFNGRIATYAAIGSFLGWLLGWAFKIYLMKE